MDTMSPAQKLDQAFNKMRAQLDFLVEAMEWQNRILAYLAEQAQDHGGDQNHLNHCEADSHAIDPRPGLQ